jgi:lipopolysaccharide export LptBFGC system permease protein LptF
MSVKIIPRYLIQILIPYLLVAAGIFSAVVFMSQFVKVFNTAVVIGASLGWIFYSMLCLTPMIITLSLPMAFQIAVLMTLAGLSDTGELMALRSAGFSFRQMVWPLAISALVLTMFLGWVNHWYAPSMYRKFEDSKHMLATQLSKIRLEPKTFMNLGEWILYSNEVNSDTGEMKNLHLFKNANDNGMSWRLRISAPEGKYFSGDKDGFRMTLYNGEIQRIDPKDTTKVVMAKFTKYDIFIPFSASARRGNISLTEMTTPEILRDVNSPKLPPQRNAEYKIEVSTRIALMISPLIFFWLSCPLGAGMTKRGRGFGLVMSIVILFGFYGAMASGISLGKKVYAMAWVFPLLPDVLGVIAGAILWKKQMNR